MIGSIEHILHALMWRAVHGGNADTDADHPQRTARVRDPSVVYCLAQLLRHSQCTVFIGLLQQHYEFLAAIAACQVILTLKMFS